MVVVVRSEIEGVVCGARGWVDESVCVGAACCMRGEGADVVDRTDWVGAWVGDDTVG